MMLFPDMIKRLRLASGKRQSDLARAIGVDVPAYSRYEHGERRPRREQVVRLARIFKADPDELVAAWLADEAYSRIAHDKLAGRAVKLLATMLTPGAPQPDVAPAASSTPQPAAPEPTIVARLGRQLLPHLVQGDAATVMQGIEDESVDCIVTTPPYWRRRRQGTEGITARSAHEYMAQLLEVMSQAHRVLSPQGSLWLNVGDDSEGGYVQGIPWRVVLEMLDQQGWHLVNEVVWNKVTTSPQGSQDHLRKVHESMFHLVKGGDYYYNDEELRHTFALIVRGRDRERRRGEGKIEDHYLQPEDGRSLVPGDVWTIGVQRSGIAHYRVAPDMLYRLPIVATCPRGGLVLDPYCGTGTACRIAYELDRRSIGIDINPAYIKQAQASIEQRPLSLF